MVRLPLYSFRCGIKCSISNHAPLIRWSDVNTRSTLLLSVITDLALSPIGTPRDLVDKDKGWNCYFLYTTDHLQ